MTPSVGGALRLSIACKLTVPLPCVVIVAVNASSGSGATPSEAVAPTDPVNLFSGGCPAQRRDRRLGAAGTASCCAVDVLLTVGGLAPGASLGALQQGGALASFLAAAAAVTGGPPSGLGVVVAEAPSQTSAAASDNGSAPAASPPTLAIAVAVSVGGVCLVLFLLIAFIVIRRRRERAAKRGDDGAATEGASHAESEGRGDVAEQNNPMLSGGERQRPRLAVPPSTPSRQTPRGAERRELDSSRSFRPNLARHASLRKQRPAELPLRLGGSASAPRSPPGRLAAPHGTLVGVGADGGIEPQTNPLHEERRRGGGAATSADARPSDRPGAGGRVTGSALVVGADGSFAMQVNPLVPHGAAST